MDIVAELEAAAVEAEDEGGGSRMKKQHTMQATTH